MPQSATSRPDAWHHAEEDQERAFLDDWMRGLICTVSLEVCPARRPVGIAQALTPAGSC